MNIPTFSKIITLLILLSFCNPFDNDYFLVPYRSGNKWGLCDTLGVVKVRPIYDGFVNMIVDESSKQSFYFVKQGNRTIVIDHNNVQQLKQYDSINPTSSRIYKGGKIGMYMYKYGSSYEGTTGSLIVLAEPLYDKIKPIIGNYIITVKGKQGLLYMDYRTPSIPLKPIYDKIIFEEPFYKAYKGGKVAATFKDPIYSAGADIAPYPADKKKSELARKTKDEDERVRMIKNLKQDLSAEELKKVTPFEITPIHKYVKYREGGKQGYVNFSYSLGGNSKSLVKNVVMPAIYDSISEAGTYKFLLKKDGRYGFYFSGRTVVPTEYDDIKFYNTYANEIILKKDGKYAIYNFNSAKILTGFEFDSYTFITIDGLQYYLILHKGAKKMLWNGKYCSQEYDELIPGYEYAGSPDKFEKYPTYFKCKKDGKFGVLSSGGISVPVVYDDVISESKAFYTIIENGKKGACLIQANIDVPPRYKSIELFKKLIVNGKPYYIFKVLDTKGVQFYTDRNGREYYQ